MNFNIVKILLLLFDFLCFFIFFILMDGRIYFVGEFVYFVNIKF